MLARSICRSATRSARMCHWRMLLFRRITCGTASTSSERLVPPKPETDSVSDPARVQALQLRQGDLHEATRRVPETAQSQRLAAHACIEAGIPAIGWSERDRVIRTLHDLETELPFDLDGREVAQWRFALRLRSSSAYRRPRPRSRTTAPAIASTVLRIRRSLLFTSASFDGLLSVVLEQHVQLIQS